MSDLKPRTTDNDHKISQEEFFKRFQLIFKDPTFESKQKSIDELAQIAWSNFEHSRKSPLTLKAGIGYADPHYDLSVDWIEARKAVEGAQKIYESDDGPSRCLVILASDRNEATCPGEISKTSRLAHIAQMTMEAHGVEVDILDLSLMTAEYGKVIYPCKGCVSTAMPLCHWPCSCYPNHSLGQTQDWMNEIYPRWVKAHGVMIITPVYWHQAPSALKLMIDRLVCADGGNDDPTSTQGKKAELAKRMEVKGWDYPRHLEGRLFSVIVHGDTVGVNELKSALGQWLEEMMLVPIAPSASISRYIGYFGTYAESHAALDEDKDIQKEVRNSALAMSAAIEAKRAGALASFTLPLKDPRPK